MKINNKKGFDGSGVVLKWVLALVLLVVLFFIIKAVYENYSRSSDQLGTCSVLGLGQGECKAEKGPNCYQFASCPSGTTYCCITLENPTGPTLPKPYGGTLNTDYDFDIMWIGPYQDGYNQSKGLPPTAPSTNCIYDKTNTNWVILICKAGTSFTIHIKVGVQNVGRGAVSVYAMPYIVTNDDLNTIYNAKGTKPVLIVRGNADALVDVPIKGQATNSFVKIYPYGLCETTECKRTDEQSRGILRKKSDDSTYFMINFVDDPNKYK